MLAQQAYSFSIPGWLALVLFLAALAIGFWVLMRTGHITIVKHEPPPLVDGVDVSLSAAELRIWLDAFTARAADLAPHRMRDGEHVANTNSQSALRLIEDACTAVLWFRGPPEPALPPLIASPYVAVAMHAWVRENADSFA